jgi:aminopeptidase
MPVFDIFFSIIIYNFRADKILDVSGDLMTEPRVAKFAKILVDFSTDIQPGERVLIEATTEAIPLVEAIYKRVLERGGIPYSQLKFANQENALLTYGENEQLAEVDIFRNYAYENFSARYSIHSLQDPRGLNDVDTNKQGVLKGSRSGILRTQMRRGATNEFKWVSTLFPTAGYAREAGMTLEAFENFVYNAVHADLDTDDPVAYWKEVGKNQAKWMALFNGHDKVTLKGPNVDLSLSVKGRTFINAQGINNMPDGEFFTGPVEDSLNGWVKYTYPAINDGRVVEGIQLKFEEGKIVKATSDTNTEYLQSMVNVDAGSSYIGEFAIGTNYEINKFTGNILFDEKIGGSFHMALGAGYPETGSKNNSQIHWDMICDMREDSEIHVDNELVYKNGKFVE